MELSGSGVGCIPGTSETDRVVEMCWRHCWKYLSKRSFGISAESARLALQTGWPWGERNGFTTETWSGSTRLTVSRCRAGRSLHKVLRCKLSQSKKIITHPEPIDTG